MAAKTLTCAECGSGIPDPRGEPVAVCGRCHRLTFLVRGGRAPSAPLPFADPACRDLVFTGMVTATASSQLGNNSPSEAIDGHPGSMWSAGSPPPAWWCADLAEIYTVSGVTIVPAMTPAIGKVLHVIETMENDEDWAPQATLDQSMTDAAVYVVQFATPAKARWVRIRTEASPSRVAWREIGIFG